MRVVDQGIRLGVRQDSVIEDVDVKQTQFSAFTSLKTYAMQSQATPVIAAPSIKVAPGPLLYKCAHCKEELPLEENAATMCQCGWRILTKVQRKTTRSFSTD
jgi:DNA-directed RNA polymerase subunit RPC12/RpoP